MNIVEVQKTGIAQNPHGVDVRRIFEGDKVQVAHITLKPGEQLKKLPHRSTYCSMYWKGLVSSRSGTRKERSARMH